MDRLSWTRYVIVPAAMKLGETTKLKRELTIICAQTGEHSRCVAIPWLSFRLGDEPYSGKVWF